MSSSGFSRPPTPTIGSSSQIMQETTATGGDTTVDGVSMTEAELRTELEKRGQEVAERDRLRKELGLDRLDEYERLSQEIRNLRNGVAPEAFDAALQSILVRKEAYSARTTIDLHQSHKGVSDGKKELEGFKRLLFALLPPESQNIPLQTDQTESDPVTSASDANQDGTIDLTSDPTGEDEVLELDEETVAYVLTEEEDREVARAVAGQKPLEGVPIIVHDTKHDIWREFHCQLCGSNTSYNGVHFFKGIWGLWLHLKTTKHHYEYLRDLGINGTQFIFDHCVKRILTAEEVEEIRLHPDTVMRLRNFCIKGIWVHFDLINSLMSPLGRKRYVINEPNLRNAWKEDKERRRSNTRKCMAFMPTIVEGPNGWHELRCLFCHCNGADERWFEGATELYFHIRKFHIREVKARDDFDSYDSEPRRWILDHCTVNSWTDQERLDFKITIPTQDWYAYRTRPATVQAKKRKPKSQNATEDDAVTKAAKAAKAAVDAAKRKQRREQQTHTEQSNVNHDKQFDTFMKEMKKRNEIIDTISEEDQEPQEPEEPQEPQEQPEDPQTTSD